MSAARRAVTWALACLTTVAALSLGACERDGGRSRNAHGSRARLRIGVRPLLTVAPIFIAKSESLYAEQGLDVELVPIEGVSSSIPMLLQGEIDVLPGPVSPSLFNAITRGGRLSIVGDKGQYVVDDCPQSVFVISRAFAKRGGTPRRIGMMKETFNRMFVERTLIAKGVRPEQVKYVYLPKAAEYDAIVSGRLDGASMSEPWLSQALRNGAQAWARVNDIMPGYQYSVIAYGPRLLDREPDVGRRVAIAHLKAMQRYNEGRTPRNLEIVGAAMGFQARELRDICWPRMREDGLIDTTSLLAFQAWAHERGDLDEVVPVGKFWDSRFVDHARQVLARPR